MLSLASVAMRVLFVIAALLLAVESLAFRPSTSRAFHDAAVVKSSASRHRGLAINSAAAALPPSDANTNTRLNPLLESLNRPVDPGFLKVELKGKTFNIWGMVHLLAIFSTACVVFPFMLAVSVSIDLFGSVAHKKRRAVLDWIVHYWSKIALTTAGCVPTLYGIENLPPAGEAVIYVPNHTSFMDILTLSGSVPRPFKYLSKEEIVKIPLIGWAMFLAQHVFLKRDNLQSTLQVSETVTQRLKDGNSMVLFAEGTRSKDGVVKTFKKGAFQMAQTAGVCELCLCLCLVIWLNLCSVVTMFRVECSMWSGALGSPGLFSSCYMITSALTIILIITPKSFNP